MNTHDEGYRARGLEKQQIEKCVNILYDTFAQNAINPWSACAAMNIILKKLEHQDKVRLDVRVELLNKESGTYLGEEIL